MKLKTTLLILVITSSQLTTASWFNFGRNNSVDKECKYLPVKEDAKKEFRPYFDKDKKFCVIPIETDASRTMAFKDSLAVDFDKYFSQYYAALNVVAEKSKEIEGIKAKIEEYETYFIQIQEYMAQFQNTPAYYRPQIDLQTPTLQYNGLLEKLQEVMKESEEQMVKANEIRPFQGTSLIHHRGLDYRYYWHKKRTKFVVLLPVPHGKTLKEAKKKFKESNFFNSISDAGSGFRDMANDVAPAMTDMRRDMGQMREMITLMQADMATMSEDMGAINSMASNFEEMTRLMEDMTNNVGMMNQSVGRMSHSVGGMSSQMKKPFMGMFSSFMPFM